MFLSVHTPLVWCSINGWFAVFWATVHPLCPCSNPSPWRKCSGMRCLITCNVFYQFMGSLNFLYACHAILLASELFIFIYILKTKPWHKMYLLYFILMRGDISSSSCHLGRGIWTPTSSSCYRAAFHVWPVYYWDRELLVVYLFEGRRWGCDWCSFSSMISEASFPTSPCIHFCFP